jgi:hypothetical protein
MSSIICAFKKRGAGTGKFGSLSLSVDSSARVCKTSLLRTMARGRWWFSGQPFGKHTNREMVVVVGLALRYDTVLIRGIRPYVGGIIPLF